MTDFQNWLQSAWARPGTMLHRLIGTPGYTLPALDGLDWHPLTADLAGGALRIAAAPDARDNWIGVPRGHEWVLPTEIHLFPGASGNVIVFGGRQLYGPIFLHGRGGLVILGDGAAHASLLDVRLWSNNQLVFWGQDSTSNGTSLVVQGDGRHILVGDDGMFANNIFVRNSDMHGLLDMQTGAALNPPGDVVIEPHVWVGQDALILKNVQVGFGSVIGAKSVVNRHVPRFTMVAGSPAQIKRSGISWDRQMIATPGMHHQLNAAARNLANTLTPL